MTTVNNPYASAKTAKKPDSVAQPPPSSTTARRPSSAPRARASLPMSSKKLLSAPKSAVNHQPPVPLAPPAAPFPTKKLSLKAKLKADIETLKRKKQLAQQQAEEAKRRKFEEKKRRKEMLQAMPKENAPHAMSSATKTPASVTAQGTPAATNSTAVSVKQTPYGAAFTAAPPAATSSMVTPSPAMLQRPASATTAATTAASMTAVPTHGAVLHPTMSTETKQLHQPVTATPVAAQASTIHLGVAPPTLSQCSASGQPFAAPPVVRPWATAPSLYPHLGYPPMRYHAPPSSLAYASYAPMVAYPSAYEYQQLLQLQQPPTMAYPLSTQPWSAATPQPWMNPAPTTPWMAATSPVVITNGPQAFSLPRRYRPRAVAKPGENRIHRQLLTAPSPFGSTHQLLAVPLTLVRHPDESFGVTVKLVTESALVEREWVEQQTASRLSEAVETPKAETKSDNAAPTTITTTTTTTTLSSSNADADAASTRRQRRASYYFSALSVVDPTTQNKRIADIAKHLQPGDLLLTINGQSTAGLTFEEAVALIKGCTALNADGKCRCQVMVARRKFVPLALPMTIAAPASTAVLRTGPLSDEEMEAFLNCLIKSGMDSQRLLGSASLEPTLQLLVKMEPALAGRSVFMLNAFWREICVTVETRASQNAEEYWRKEWAKESDEVRMLPLPFMTDAQRSAKRLVSRPAKGCRCGSEDHEYVNNPACPLYSNLRRLLPESSVEETSQNEASRKFSSKLSKDLNVVEKAFKDRFVRMKAEQQSQESEAKFVSLMEDIQLNQRKQAVFAPSLTAMVLSAVVELQDAFEGEPPFPAVPKAKEGPEPTKDEDDSDDDDVPLTALGKRRTQDESNKHKRQTEVRLKFLAKLVGFISEKWGHVCREPADEDHAWRWEVYHGQLSDSGSKWAGNTKNPRRAGGLCLENVRFGVSEQAALRVEDSVRSKEKLAALSALATALVPDKTGVLDELMALVGMDVLRVDERGVPVLTNDWWANVDLLLLEDMNNNWALKVDPQGKFGVDDSIRKPLGAKWRRLYHGWAFADNLKEIIFDFEEFDEWREAFEEKQQEQIDDSEGIGRFGI